MSQIPRPVQAEGEEEEGEEEEVETVSTLETFFVLPATRCSNRARRKTGRVCASLGNFCHGVLCECVCVCVHSFKNHEKSKKHREKLAILKQILEEEEELRRGEEGNDDDDDDEISSDEELARRESDTAGGSDDHDAGERLHDSIPRPDTASDPVAEGDTEAGGCGVRVDRDADTKPPPSSDAGGCGSTDEARSDDGDKEGEEEEEEEEESGLVGVEEGVDRLRVQEDPRGESDESASSEEELVPLKQ